MSYSKFDNNTLFGYLSNYIKGKQTLYQVEKEILPSNHSKWALLAEKIENDSDTDFDDYAE